MTCAKNCKNWNCLQRCLPALGAIPLPKVPFSRACNRPTRLVKVRSNPWPQTLLWHSFWERRLLQLAPRSKGPTLRRANMSTAVSLFLFLASFVVGSADRPPHNRFSRSSTWSSGDSSHAQITQYFVTSRFQAQLRAGARQFPREHGIQGSTLQTAHYLETRSLPLDSLLTSLPEVLPVSDEKLGVASSGGLTFDNCQKASECKGIRRCLDLTDFPESRLCSGGDYCFCLPPEPASCTRTTQCVPGEVCANLRNLTRPLCVSAVVEDESVAFIEVSSENPPEPPAPPLSGLTFDFCQEQEDCSGDRTCVLLDSLTDEVCGGRDPCVCRPPVLEECKRSDTCPRGEVCVIDPQEVLLRDICVSESTARKFPEVFVTPEPPPGSSSGLTLDVCETRTHCLGTRKCFQSPPSSGVVCPEDVFASCRCYPATPERCQSSGQCEIGEICAVEAETGSPLCVSENAVEQDPSLITDPNLPSINDEQDPDTPFPVDEPTNTVGALPEASATSDGTGVISGASTPSGQPASPSASGGPSPEGGVCVDARILRHLKQEELVLQRHVRARVLCDPDDNCATDGHMVMYRGQAMMMRTYCQRISCVERVMYVNSPRYRRGIRLASNTKDLQFTAFAAKYSSTAEETILSMATRIGM